MDSRIMTKVRTGGLVLLVLCVLGGRSHAGQQSEGKPPSQAVVLQMASEAHSPRERLLVALALDDTTSARAALDEKDFPPALAHWHRARLAQAEGDRSGARRQWKSAWKRWGYGSGERAALAAAFDRQYVTGMLGAGALKDARKARQAPWGEHGDDAVWDALGGVLALQEGDVANAILRLDGAWRRADRLLRRDRVFAHRALAHLAGGDAFSAIESWLKWTGNLRSGRGRLQAWEFWNAHPELLEAARSTHRRSDVARWLAGRNHRQEALALALEAWHSGSGKEARQGYLIAAEQLYRLRRHRELLALLQEKAPAGLDDEERATLAAYPWGVRRRQGASTEVAEGFDQVSRAFARTRRGVEAQWEAAWMWELTGGLEEAEEHFLRYADEHPRAPFARAAALRAIYLPYRRGEFELTVKRADQLARSLGDGPEEAAALWLAARSAEALGDSARARVRWERLRAGHGDSPFLGTAAAVELPEAVDRVGERLYRSQLRAFESLAEALELPAPLFEPPEADWQEAQALLDWGFFEDGEIRLQRAARLRGHDARAALRATALAWAAGRAARQAREGWWLRRRLKKRTELTEAVDVATWPTPFAPMVLAAARERGLPPGLLWSLIRRESFYEPAVVSGAGAWGLMQLLPTTAEKVARSLGERPPQRPEELLGPGVNLRWGSAYLRQLLDTFDGDPFEALAAYNAGESNSRRWKARMGEDDPPAEMILRISYSETRAYVYEVMRGWKVYERILRDGEG